MLLIERGEGVETKPIKTSYSPSAGTAYVTFENVMYLRDYMIFFCIDVFITGIGSC